MFRSVLAQKHYNFMHLKHGKFFHAYCTTNTNALIHKLVLHSGPTGMGILERSRPMQFFMIVHRLSLWEGLGGMVLRRFGTVGSHLSKKLDTGP